MPYAIEEKDGLYIVRVRGETSAAEMRQRFRIFERLLVPGPAFILVIFEKHCRYLEGPHETLRLQLACAEALKGCEGGALAFLSHEEVLFGICRQFQLLAFFPALRIGAFNEMSQALDWLDSARTGMPDLAELC